LGITKGYDGKEAALPFELEVSRLRLGPGCVATCPQLIRRTLEANLYTLYGCPVQLASQQFFLLRQAKAGGGQRYPLFVIFNFVRDGAFEVSEVVVEPVKTSLQKSVACTPFSRIAKRNKKPAILTSPVSPEQNALHRVRESLLPIVQVRIAG
jgi:hypothetical protein